MQKISLEIMKKMTRFHSVMTLMTMFTSKLKSIQL